MTNALGSATDEFIQVAGSRLHYLKAGTGDPLLILHQDVGSPGWQPIHERLAAGATVYAPDLPGWGRSDRADWMRGVRDLAVYLLLFLDELELDGVTLVGLGLGGWLAAEMATMAQRRFTRLVLVGAAGLQPPEGEIIDQFLLAYDAYVKAGFADAAVYERVYTAEPPTELLMQWDVHREMVARVAWEPYMYSRTLPHLLPGLRLPTLIVWGAADRVVPPSCGRRYADLVPSARLEIVDGAGHYVELEQPERLAALIAAAQ